MKRTILEITKMIAVENKTDDFNAVEVKGVCFDTRKIKKGDLFVPLKSAVRDGHDFVEQAKKGGAVATFWQKGLPNPPLDFPVLIVQDTLEALQKLAKAYKEQVNPKVIAITGSNGKTTTKDIAKAIVGTQYRVHATKGNFNNHIGLPYTILTMPEDTEVAIFEMGMNNRHEIERLSAIATPDIALITNIGEAHIENLNSREEIAKAKLEITAGMTEKGLLVYPEGEPLISKNLPRSLRTATFGREKSADIYPLTIKTLPDETTFTTNLAKEIEFKVPIVGEHNAFNTMAVLLATQELNISHQTAKKALLHLERSKNRLEWLETKQGTRILNDAYNSSPTALKAVLNTFMNMPSSGHRKIGVLADMLELGRESAKYHRASAEIIQPGKIDLIYTYGEEMRNFSDEAIKHLGHEKVHHFDTKEALIKSLLQEVKGEEWILVKGSNGMGLQQVVQAIMEEAEKKERNYLPKNTK